AYRGCPHRGADLALGRVVGGELQCPYHGFRFRGDGRCSAIPCEGRGAKIPAKLHLETESVVEENGFIWLYCRESEDDNPPATRPWIDGLPETHAGVASRDLEWDAPLSRVMEGMLDIHHSAFAHSRYVPRRLT